MIETLLRFILTKLAGLRRCFQVMMAKTFTARETPELLEAYAAFGRASQSGSSRQPFKGWDLWKLLERYRPQSIIELGSGTTSAVFALWTRRNNVRYRSYEHYPAWAQVTENCLSEAGLLGEKSPLCLCPSRVNPEGTATGFVEKLPVDVDFVYVDGPPCRLEDGRKVPNDDVVRLFDAGGRPRVIVVDGRLDTVDLIRFHPEGRRYRFLPSLVYCLRRGLWRQGLAAREHTLLVRD